MYFWVEFAEKISKNKPILNHLRPKFSPAGAEEYVKHTVYTIIMDMEIKQLSKQHGCKV